MNSASVRFGHYVRSHNNLVLRYCRLQPRVTSLHFNNPAAMFSTQQKRKDNDNDAIETPIDKPATSTNERGDKKQKHLLPFERTLYDQDPLITRFKLPDDADTKWTRIENPKPFPDWIENCLSHFNWAFVTAFLMFNYGIHKTLGTKGI